MSLIKWTPRRTYLAPFEEIDRFFDTLFKRSLDGTVFDSGSWMPAFDVLENDKEYVIRVEAPGMKKSDINVSLKDNVLTISGEKKDENKSENDRYFFRESVYGQFSRSFHLEEGVDEKKIKADYKNGVLTITIPRKKPVKPKKIEVEIN